MLAQSENSSNAILCFIRGSSPTSHPSQTWGVLTQSGSSWWWVVWCSSSASLVASERCVKTLSCSNLYVFPLNLLQRRTILTLFATSWAHNNTCEIQSAVYLYLFQFSVFLGIIFFLELTAGVLAFVFKDWIKDQLNFFINNNIRAYRDDIDLQNLIDFTQEYVSTCLLDPQS